MTTTAPLALASDKELIAELARRGTIVYLVGHTDDFAAEYPQLARDDILGGLYREAGVPDPHGHRQLCVESARPPGADASRSLHPETGGRGSHS